MIIHRMHANQETRTVILAEYESTVSQKLLSYKINDLDYMILSTNEVTFPVIDID